MGDNLYFLGLVAFLLPIAAYCLVLAMINRRINPVMVSGVWDTVGLLLACSGGLLVCGPGIIYYHYNRNSIYQGIERDDEGNPIKRERPKNDQENKEDAEAVSYHVWWYFTWASYYLLVLTGAVLLVLSRRNKTIVYNVDPDLLEQMLGQTLENCNLAGVRDGRKIVIGPRKDDDADRPDADRPDADQPAASSAENPGEGEGEVRW